MEQELIQLGFTLKEAKIYLAMLELGPSTVSRIARKAGLNRTSAYDIIKPLEEQGLIVLVGGRNKLTYSAEPLEKLPLLLESKAQEYGNRSKKARALLPQLFMLKQRNFAQPKISLFEGVSGIRHMYEDTLLSSEEIKSFSSTDSLESFDKKYLHEYYKRRADKRIFIKAIINDTPSAREYKNQDKKLYRELRIVPTELMDITPEIYVYDNKIALFSLAERFGVLIESWDMATAIKRLYDLAWDKAADYNKLKNSKRKSMVA